MRRFVVKRLRLPSNIISFRREEYGALLCPECYCDLGFEYEEGVPPYVKNASKR